MLKTEQVISSSAYKDQTFYTATAIHNGQRVIVKVGDQRLKNEAVVLSSVKYKNIPKLIELTHLPDGRFQLIEELLPGQPLGEYIGLDGSWNSQKLPLEEVQTIVRGLANCLIAMRDEGYLYRDLNLNHVLVNGTGVSLVDVEAAIKFETPGVWRANDRIGTWEAMPHEEFGVGNRLLENTTTYMLGALTLQLTTGSNPFFVSPEKIPNHEVRRLFVRDLHKEIPVINTGNPSLDALLVKTLQPAPSKRFEKIEHLQVAINNLTVNGGVN